MQFHIITAISWAVSLLCRFTEAFCIVGSWTMVDTSFCPEHSSCRWMFILCRFCFITKMLVNLGVSSWSSWVPETMEWSQFRRQPGEPLSGPHCFFVHKPTFETENMSAAFVCGLTTVPKNMSTVNSVIRTVVYVDFCRSVSFITSSVVSRAVLIEHKIQFVQKKFRNQTPFVCSHIF